MKKRFKQILMLGFAVTLFLPQFGTVQKASAAGGSDNGNYVLKVETAGGKQWDGLQISTGADGLNLVADSTYTFSYDLYTPDQDVAGIILQTSGNYNWIKNTDSLSAASPAWTSYTATYTYLAESGEQIQFVKAGDGGATDTKNITYYIDNFVVKDESDTVVYKADFEDQTVGGFTQSGTATLSAVAPDYFLKIQTTGGNQWDGLQIDTGASGLNLVADSTYTFSYDLYTPDQDVAGIILQTSGNYNWIKNTESLSAASPAWTSYTATYTYLAESGEQIQFVKAGDGGATDAKNITYYINNFVVKDEVGTVVYEANFDDQTVGGFTQSGTAALTTVLSINASTPPTDPPPASDKVVVAYDLQEDPGLVDIMTNGGTAYLQKAGGPTLSRISNTDGTIALEISNRVNSWDAIDVKAAALGLVENAAYNVKLAGHIPDGVTIPSGAKIALNHSSAGEITSVDATASFTLDYEDEWDASDDLRIQASEGLTSFVIDSLIIEVKGGIEMPRKPLSTVPGIHVSSTTKGDGWSGVNIILGLDRTQWPFSSSTEDDAVAFTPVKDAKYHLTFNATSTGATGYRVRWIAGNENGGYTGADAAVVSDAAYSYAAGTIATTVPGSFTSGVNKGETLDYAVDFVMSGSEPADGLIGNLAIRGTAGSNDFTINSIKITDDTDNVLVEWSNTDDPFIPDDYVWPESKWDLALPSLKDAYSQYFLIGNILGWGGDANATPWGQENDQADQALKKDTVIEQTENMFKAQYNVVTPENIMKPENISKAKDTYDYTVADKLIDWAKTNNIAVHGHTLVWHQQSPAWLNKGDAANRESAKANLESYIANVAEHFKGQVISWDVVNEAFSDATQNFDGSDWTTGLRKDSPWYIAYANGADPNQGESGADYIYDAFVAARLVDPDAMLYYNDYNETYKYEQIAQMAESLNAKWETDSRNTDQARKLIEGVGMQSHFWVGQDPDVDITEVETTIERFIQAGLRISVSELDIPFAKNNNYHLDEAKQEQQAELYGTLFTIYKKYADSIDRITFWGKADIQSWRGSGMPVLFDNSYRPKEAFWTVIGLGDHENSAISPTTATFYTNSQSDARVNVTLKGNALRAIMKGDAALVADRDYSAAAASANGTQVVTIKKSYLATLSNNDVLTFVFSGGNSADLKIRVTRYTSSDSTPASGSGSGTESSAGTESGSEGDSGSGAENSGSTEQTPTPEKPLLNSKLVDAEQMKAAVQQALQANQPINFSDVPAAHWSAKAVQLASQLGIVKGEPNSEFKGSNPVTRAEFAEMMVNALGMDITGEDGSFSDTNGHWADAYIRALHRAGIANGTSKGAFNPDQEITRAEMAAILARIMNMSAASGTKFSDIGGSWAAEYINQLSQAGIVNGIGDGQFAPNATATRDQSVVIIMRMLNIVLDLGLDL
ncbi:endo-1,4-beta-xylanase [Cohnella cellulosilytica]|uniref:Beta-xylanase n=1 Tax=Cohnella cellulosilytica TaxID=986710 RepID=A0ABW2F8X6_9BACL